MKVYLVYPDEYNAEVEAIFSEEEYALEWTLGSDAFVIEHWEVDKLRRSTPKVKNE